MSQFVQTLSVVASLAAALLTAMFGAFEEMSVLTILLRAVVVGGLVFAFLRFGGDLAGRSVLRGLAEHQVSQEQSRDDEAEGENDSPAERKAA